MKQLTLFFTWLISASALFAQITQPITSGKLTNDLNANNQDVEYIKNLGLGNTTNPSARIHILPGTGGTTEADGIWLGNDIKFYRTSAGEVTLLGNLTVTGTVGTSGSLITLSGANAWSGANTWSSSSTFSGAVVLTGTGGLTFTGGNAATAIAATKTSLGLVIGTNVQAYDADLTALAAITPGTTIPVGNGTSWIAGTPTTIRAAAGMGTGDTVTIGAIVTSGNSTLGNDNADTLAISGPTTWANATSSGTGLTINGVTLYTTGGVLTSTGPMAVTGNIAGTTMSLATALGVASGGTGLNATGGVDRIMYSTGATTWATTALSTYMRGVLASADLAALQTTVLTATSGGDISGTYPTLAIRADAVTSSKIFDGTIVAADLATDAVITAKIQDSAVTAVKIAANTITSGKFAVGAVDAAALAVTSVTAATYGTATLVPRIAVDEDGRITGVTEVAVTATPSGPAGGSLTGSYPDPTIAAGGVVAGNIATNAVTTATIADSAITTVKIANSQVTAGKLNLAAALQTFIATTTKATAFDSISPTTTKGDISAHNGTNNIRLAVGATNGMHLVADSGEATGLKWVPENRALATLVDVTPGLTLVAGRQVHNATVTITADSTFAFAGTPEAGMNGRLIVKATGGPWTLALPGAPKIEANGVNPVACTSGKADILTWFYDGTDYYWTVDLNFD